MIRDHAIQGFSVGAGAAAVGAAGAALIKFGAPQEAVLSLLGALIGASATVAGAAWLADRNSNAEQRAETGLLIEEIQTIRDHAKALLPLAPGPDNDWCDEFRAGILALDMPLREIHSIVTEALDHGKQLTFRQRTRLRQMEVTSDQAWKFYRDCYLSEDDLHPLDERTWDRTLPHNVKDADRALAELRRRA